MKNLKTEVLRIMWKIETINTSMNIAIESGGDEELLGAIQQVYFNVIEEIEPKLQTLINEEDWTVIEEFEEFLIDNGFEADDMDTILDNIRRVVDFD